MSWIRYHEYLSVMVYSVNNFNIKFRCQAFELLDSDHSGSIELSEISAVVDKLNTIMKTSFTIKQVVEIFKAGDLNGDGKISRDGTYVHGLPNRRSMPLLSFLIIIFMVSEFAELWSRALVKASALQKFGNEFISAAFVDLTLRKIGILSYYICKLQDYSGLFVIIRRLYP